MSAPPPLRFESRLAHLTRQQLFNLAVEQAGATQEGLRIADAHLSEHVPLPEWAVTEVLLSNDLLPHVMRTLGAENLAAMQVCKVWRTCWRETLEPRRILHLSGPPVVVEWSSTMSHPAIVALDGERLALLEQSTLPRISLWDRQLQALPALQANLAAPAYTVTGNSSLYISDSNTSIYRYSQDDFTLLAHHERANMYEICFADGVLFVVCSVEPDDDWNQLAAYDADSLEHRFDFGPREGPNKLFKGIPYGLAAHGGELFVCDHGGHCLHVFSFTGEYRRTVRGAFWSPIRICFVNDRMYLFEDYEHDDREELEETDEATRADMDLAGNRIHVLTPEGKPLQVLYSPPGQLFINQIVQLGEAIICHMCERLPQTPKKLDLSKIKLARLAGV